MLLASPFVCYRRELVDRRQTLLPIFLGRRGDQTGALAQTVRYIIFAKFFSYLCNSYDRIFAKYEAPDKTRYKQ
jgi:hypothetical protein